MTINNIFHLQMLQTLAHITNSNIAYNQCKWYKQVHMLQPLSHTGRPSDVVHIRAWPLTLSHFHPIFSTLPLGVRSSLQRDALATELSDWIMPTTSFLKPWLSRTSPKGMPETPWAQWRPRSDTRYLWRWWWEGPSDPSVGEGPRRWERLPPTGNRSHEGRAMSYA
jgi:hypothetical protein